MNYRKELILNIFNSNNINNKYDANEYIKNYKLDKVGDILNNKDIDYIINGIEMFYCNDFKQKKLFDLYNIIVLDFINNNDEINFNNKTIFTKLLRKISLLDKGYLLLNIIHTKYNLTNYSSSLLENVLKKGTFTNLLFWKKIMTDKYILTLSNLALVIKNSDIRMLKYFIDNFVNNFINNGENIGVNNILVSKILSNLVISEHIPLKFKLKRLKMLNKIIDFNEYLDIMFIKLPLFIINNIYKYYNFDSYILNINDLEKLNESKSLFNFYNLTNQSNKNIISLLVLFRGYKMNDEILSNINNIINEKPNMDKYIFKLFSICIPDNKSFYNRNSNNYNKDYYKLMTNIMKTQFIQKFNIYNECTILDYVYYLLPFIENIKLDINYMISINDNFKLEKSYLILKKFFNNIYNKTIKYNRMMKLLNSENNNILLSSKTIKNPLEFNIYNISKMKNIYNYYCYYYDGIMTNKLPPDIYPIINIDFNFVNLKCIYLEDESLYLIITDDLNLIYQHEYLNTNNIKLDYNNYKKVLEDFIKDNKYTSNKWFPLIIFDNINNNCEYISFNNIEDIYNNKYNIVKNKENIYIKLKIVIDKDRCIKLVDYENNEYKIISNIKQNLDSVDNNSIIKYYPYRNNNDISCNEICCNDISCYEICYYSVKPNKKGKIDYLLNL